MSDLTILRINEIQSASKIFLMDILKRLLLKVHLVNPKAPLPNICLTKLILLTSTILLNASLSEL